MRKIPLWLRIPNSPELNQTDSGATESFEYCPLPQTQTKSLYVASYRSVIHLSTEGIHFLSLLLDLEQVTGSP